MPAPRLQAAGQPGYSQLRRYPYGQAHNASDQRRTAVGVGAGRSPAWRCDESPPELGWPGGAARRRHRASPPALRGCAVNLPSPAILHEMYGRELAELLDKIAAGEVPAVAVDQATAERWLFRLAGALMRVQEQHRVDERGRCSICWPLPPTWWRPWSKRSTCTVYSALGFFLRQPDRFLLTAVTDQTRPVSVRRAP